MTSIFDICNLEYVSKDRFLKDACERVHRTLVESNKSMVESQLARELISPALSGNVILHGSYLRTALDILTSEGLVKKKGAKYSLK